MQWYVCHMFLTCYLTSMSGKSTRVKFEMRMRRRMIYRAPLAWWNSRLDPCRPRGGDLSLQSDARDERPWLEKPVEAWKDEGWSGVRYGQRLTRLTRTCAPVQHAHEYMYRKSPPIRISIISRHRLYSLQCPSAPCTSAQCTSVIHQSSLIPASNL